MKRRRFKWLALAVLAAIVLAMVPAISSADGFQAMVISGSMPVYQQSAPHSYLGALPQGTRVTVEAYKGAAALISYNGRTGIARVSDMMAIAGSAAPAQPQSQAATETASAAEAAAGHPMVTSRSTRVYQRATTASRYVNVRAGLEVNLLASQGNVARVEKNGIVGYTPLSHLAEPGASALTPTSNAADSGVERYDNIPVMTTETARVYSQPSTSSKYVTVPKGTQMVLIAVKGNCAMVQKNGVTGYIAKSQLTTQVSAAEAPAAQPETVADKTAEAQPAQDTGAYTGSNEEIVYKFLVRELGYNTAAACGVMANIKYESGYKPTSSSSTGAYYGIAQWGGGRKTRLVSWCGSNGYDYTSLIGQLYYLKYELTSYYPSVHNRLKAVENSDQGAYDAGYDFCYNFEAPSNRASKSDTRGNYARTTLWNRYKA